MIAAVVTQVSPLLVTMPSVTGIGTVSAVLVQPGAPPAVGDPVWVDRTDGFPGWLVVNVPAATPPAMLVPTGAITPFAGSAAPTGWLLCDGSTAPRVVYPALYALIGTTYGPSTSTLFTLPNLQGRTVTGLNPADSDFDTRGKIGGAKTASHSHALSDNGQAQIYTTTGGVIGMRRINTPTYTETLEFTATRTAGTAGAATLGAALTGATDAAAPSTLQPFMALTYIVKT